MKLFLRSRLRALAYTAQEMRREERRLTRSVGNSRDTRIYDCLTDEEFIGATRSRPVGRAGMIPWARQHQRPAEEIQALEAEHKRLHVWRVGPLRNEARVANLAYAFLRGRTYAKTEAPGSKAVAATMVAREIHGPGWSKDTDLINEIRAWVAGKAPPSAPTDAGAVAKAGETQ